MVSRICRRPPATPTYLYLGRWTLRGKAAGEYSRGLTGGIAREANARLASQRSVPTRDTTHPLENAHEAPEMLVASICCEVYVTVLPNASMASRVPRCLFGRPNSRETLELLQEALDEERSKFAERWGVDPCAEDKENNYQRRTNERTGGESACNKKRNNNNPYSRQTSIHGERHFFREISARAPHHRRYQACCSREFNRDVARSRNIYEQGGGVSHARRACPKGLLAESTVEFSNDIRDETLRERAKERSLPALSSGRRRFPRL